MRPAADRLIEMDDAQLREDELPVVAFDLGAGLPAKQHQLQVSRVGDVGRQVDEVLAGPPGADGRAEQLRRILAEEGDRRDHRDQELQEAAAEYGHELAEHRKDEMARFVEDQIGQVEQRVHRIRTDRGSCELPRPDGEAGDERDARPLRDAAERLVFDAGHASMVTERGIMAPSCR